IIAHSSGYVELYGFLVFWPYILPGDFEKENNGTSHIHQILAALDKPAILYLPKECRPFRESDNAWWQMQADDCELVRGDWQAYSLLAEQRLALALTFPEIAVTRHLRKDLRMWYATASSASTTA